MLRVKPEKAPRHHRSPRLNSGSVQASVSRDELREMRRAAARAGVGAMGSHSNCPTQVAACVAVCLRPLPSLWVMVVRSTDHQLPTVRVPCREAGDGGSGELGSGNCFVRVPLLPALVLRCTVFRTTLVVGGGAAAE